MPLPTPNPSEERESFIGRCMGSPTMNADFPDESQRDERVKAAMLALDELGGLL